MNMPSEDTMNEMFRQRMYDFAPEPSDGVNSRIMDSIIDHTQSRKDARRLAANIVRWSAGAVIGACLTIAYFVLPFDNEPLEYSPQILAAAHLLEDIRKDAADPLSYEQDARAADANRYEQASLYNISDPHYRLLEADGDFIDGDISVHGNHSLPTYSTYFPLVGNSRMLYNQKLTAKNASNGAILTEDQTQLAGILPSAIGDNTYISTLPADAHTVTNGKLTAKNASKSAQTGDRADVHHPQSKRSEPMPSARLPQSAQLRRQVVLVDDPLAPKACALFCSLDPAELVYSHPQRIAGKLSNDLVVLAQSRFRRQGIEVSAGSGRYSLPKTEGQIRSVGVQNARFAYTAQFGKFELKTGLALSRSVSDAEYLNAEQYTDTVRRWMVVDSLDENGAQIGSMHYETEARTLYSTGTARCLSMWIGVPVLAGLRSDWGRYSLSLYGGAMFMKNFSRRFDSHSTGGHPDSGYTDLAHQGRQMVYACSQVQLGYAIFPHAEVFANGEYIFYLYGAATPRGVRSMGMNAGLRFTF